MFVVEAVDGILNDGSITETKFIILLNQCLFCFLVTLVGEFLRFEDVIELVGFVNFTESTFAEEWTLDSSIGKFVITVEYNLVYTHFVFLVDINIEDNLISSFLLALENLNLCILIAFIIEIFLGKNLGTVNDITSKTHTFHHT